MSSEVRLGLVGCGGNGSGHARRSREVDGARMVAFADAREGAARALAAEFPGAYATTDPARIFEDSRVDAVIVSTHHDSHAELAIAAARAGKHLLVEKPLALTVEECRRIEEAVDRSGVRAMVGFKMRYMPLVQEVHRLLPRPILLVGQIMDNRWADDWWAQDPRSGGGNVLSQGVHNFDLLCYLAGAPPTRIYADGGTLTHRGTDVIDSVFGVIRFENGCVASILNADAGTPAFTSKFFCEVFDGERTATLHQRCHRGRIGGAVERALDAAADFPGEDPEGFVQELAEFVACAREDRAPTIGASLADGTQATRLALAAFESVRTGEAVRL